MMDEWTEKRKHLVRYMKEIKQKYHRIYVIKYLICEALSILSIIFNMFLMKWVINDFWVEYKPAMSSFVTGCGLMSYVVVVSAWYHHGGTGRAQIFLLVR